MEMTMRKKWQEPQMQSNPYLDYIQELNNCNSVVKEKLLNDSNYREVDNYCENLIKQSLYETIIPQIINTQQGRVAFERLLQTTCSLKEKYTQEDVVMQQKLQKLMSDDVVQKRLLDLQKQ